MTPPAPRRALARLRAGLRPGTRPRSGSLRLRLGLAGLACISAALALAALGLSSLFATHVERRAEADLTMHFDQVLAGLTRRDGQLTVGGPLSDPRFGRVYGGLYWQIDTAGGQSRSRSLWDGTLPGVAGAAGPVFLRLAGPQGEELLARVQTIALPAALGGGTARITLARDARELDAARRDFTRDMLPYLLVLGLVLIAAGAGQIALGLRPLRLLRARVGRLRRGHAARMGTGWPSEVQPLTREVDALLDQHEAEVARARHRAADLAHGLKTPLQALLGEAGRLRADGRDAAAQSLEDLALRMRRHLDFELARTRFETAAADPVADLGKVATGVLSVLARTPAGGRLEIRTDIAPGLRVGLEEGELAELLGALAENAVRHARGLVTLAARADPEPPATGPGRIRLLLSDDGPGLPESRRAALMVRGARLDESGDGTGLGLAIARDIVLRRGGTLDLTRADAGGLGVVLTLPGAAHPHRGHPHQGHPLRGHPHRGQSGGGR